mgnify:CR=1 FL=1
MIEVKECSKAFGTVKAVNKATLDVGVREVFGLVGSNGAGKSTTVKTCAGLVRAESGSIKMEGREIAKGTCRQFIDQGVILIPEGRQLFAGMTVYENLAFGLEIKKVPKNVIRSEIERGLKLVNMSGYEKKYPGQLSGGQQQRIAIARALLLKPSVLLLDEPFSALDGKIRAQMREELKRIQEELNITVVFVTHDQEEAMALSHRIVVMNKGFIEQIGTPTEIYDHPATRFVASFIGEMNFLTKQDGSSVAVRPEDVTITRGEVQGQLSGDVRTIMVLGHFVEVNVEVENRQVIKTYVARNVADQLHMKDRVSLSFAKTFQYCA